MCYHYYRKMRFWDPAQQWPWRRPFRHHAISGALFFLLTVFFFYPAAAAPPHRIRSVWVYRGTIRVWTKPTYKSAQRGMIKAAGRFLVHGVSPPGGGCKHRWYKLGPHAHACSGWLIPSTKPATPVTVAKLRRGPVSWTVGIKPKTIFYKNLRRLRRGRGRLLRGLTGFGIVGRRLWKKHVYLETVEGGWIPQVSVRSAPKTSLVGVTVTRQRYLPIAFMLVHEVRVWKINRRPPVPSGKSLARYSVRRVYGTRHIGKRCFYRLGGGRGVPCRSARIAPRPPPPPARVAADERWLDVDGRHTMLYARKGAKVKRVMLVSLSPRTPRGVFRIQAKHLFMTLHNQRHPDPWYLEKVADVAFFHKSFALHGAYWHDDFGTLRTHGCVNLSPVDARWVFKFMRPRLPPGYVRINAIRQDPGSRIRIRFKP
jgi:hypothetical protein